MAEQQAMNRADDLRRLYELLDHLKERHGGTRTLAQLDQHRDWPSRGVYFFFEPGEVRSESGTGQRLVRVGTHALTDGSRSTLRQRLAQHRGLRSGDGNHRGSIFRLLVGQALLADRNLDVCPSWGVKGDAGKAATLLGVGRDVIRATEEPVEREVSERLWAMPFLWLRIEDAPGPSSTRGFVERNCIALVSNYQRDHVDAPSQSWLGHNSNRPHVRGSGLWNQRHVDEEHDPKFLALFEQLVRAQEARPPVEEP